MVAEADVLKMLDYISSQHLLEPEDYVRVVEGPLKENRGFVIAVHDDNQVEVEVKVGSQTVSAIISKSWLRKLKNTPARDVEVPIEDDFIDVENEGLPYRTNDTRPCHAGP